MKQTFLAIIVALALPFGADAAKKKRQPSVSPEVLMEQALEAFRNYDTELASDKISRLNSLREVPDPEELESLEARVERMEAMLQRVDAIEVIDSINVSRDDFFASYRLNPACGYILSPADLGTTFEAASPSTVYLSENGSVMLWGTEAGLVESHKLTDGSWENPSPLSENLNSGGVANYPFLMPDGITLYYATKGDDSLGGYDIYVSRRNGEDFPSPQNLGMPYNSPYDDFLLAIDEETGAGWWASDRNSPGGDVTIYIFVPSETRVNVDVDDPQLALRARLADISLSQSGKDYSSLLAAINAIEPGAGMADMTPDFEFVLPDGRVITRWDGFRSDRARRLMENYLDAVNDYDTECKKLDSLRMRYGKGEKAVASTILQMENKLKASAAQLKSMSNRIIEAELR